MKTVATLKGKDHFIQTNGIQLHYIEYKSDGPTLILFHGLTANAHAFDGLIAAGLHPACNVISVDLRGRGLSEQPDHDYTMSAHAKDVIGLMDSLKMEKAIIGGHSFGALLCFFLAANYPDRFEKLILLDAAAQMHPKTKEMLVPAMSRLGQVFPSFDLYIDKVKSAPYIDFWDEQMKSYYKADVKEVFDGIMPIPLLKHMIQAVNGAIDEPWLDYIPSIKQEAILINGPGVYTMNAALLPEEYARTTVNMMKHCSYVKVPGNHQTMLYGDGAKKIVTAIKDFIS
ncbi:MAG: alpha/beta fold hydrolase [Flavisolibacter sp.]